MKMRGTLIGGRADRDLKLIEGLSFSITTTHSRVV